MTITKSNHRTDEQLVAMLAETSNWIVNGTQGQTLGKAVSLHHAIQRASAYAQSGAVVVAITRTGPIHID